MRRQRLDSIDRAILRFLFRHRNWATTNNIAERSGIAWATANDHLKDLARHGYVVRGQKGELFYWKVNG